MAINSLLRTISNMPELAGRVSPSDLQRMVIRTNAESYYHQRGLAPLSVMIRGGDLSPHLGIEQAPLYYTMTASGSVHTGNVSGIRLTTDLAKDMGFKNALAEVCLAGGKSVLYLTPLGYFAVTCVYGDEALFAQGDVIAKGGLRIIAQEGMSDTDIHRVCAEAIPAYLRAFVGLGTLGISRSEGPDMKPECLNEGEIMKLMYDIGVQASIDLGKELVPFTTSGPGKYGFFNHDEWGVTSYGWLEYLCAFLSNRSATDHFGIDTNAPVTMNIQGYGEVGSNIVRLLKEIQRYSKFGFSVTGVSDHSSAYYNPAGFDLGMLYAMAKERERGWGSDPNVPFKLISSGQFDRIDPYRIERDDLIFMPATISVAAGPAYVIQNPNDVSRLRTQIWSPVANAALGTKTSSRQDVRDIEMAMKAAGIASIPGWILNPGGIQASKEEIYHGVMAGGLANLTNPQQRIWFQEHVTEADISDTAWANMDWALHEWKKEGYQRPLSDIMEERVVQIQARSRQILLGWERTPDLMGNLSRMDSATIRAKVEVTARDYSESELSVMRQLLTNWDAPEEERRVAAYVLGRLSSHSYLEDFMKILERGFIADMDADAQSPVMFRNAATGLGYILEGKENLYGDIIYRLQTIRGILRRDVTPENIKRLVPLDWLLSKLGY